MPFHDVTNATHLVENLSKSIGSQYYFTKQHLDFYKMVLFLAFPYYLMKDILNNFDLKVAVKKDLVMAIILFFINVFSYYVPFALFRENIFDKRVQDFLLFIIFVTILALTRFFSNLMFLNYDKASISLINKLRVSISLNVLNGISVLSFIVFLLLSSNANRLMDDFFKKKTLSYYWQMQQRQEIIKNNLINENIYLSFIQDPPFFIYDQEYDLSTNKSDWKNSMVNSLYRDHGYIVIQK